MRLFHSSFIDAITRARITIPEVLRSDIQPGLLTLSTLTNDSGSYLRQLRCQDHFDIIHFRETLIGTPAHAETSANNFREAAFMLLNRLQNYYECANKYIFCLKLTAPSLSI